MLQSILCSLCSLWFKKFLANLDQIMSVLSIISTLGDVFTALCVLAIFPWIMGVPGDPGPPGQESNYARGWTMGLIVICVYPILRIVGVAAVWVARFFADSATQTRVESISASCGALIFGLAIVRLMWAFRVLSRR